MTAYKRSMDRVSPLPVPTAEEPLDALDRGVLVVTANQRAARTLTREFSQHRLAAGVAAWSPPKLLSWDAWTAALWQRLLLEGHDARLLLSGTQELQLWRSAIETDAARNRLETLEDAAALAELAADAWQRLHAYRSASRLRSSAPTPDTRAFQRWAEIFRRRCATDEYLTSAELEGVIESAIGAAEAGFRILADDAPAELLLIGFDTTTPAQASLLAAIKATGIAVHTPEQAARGTLSLHTAEDPLREIHAAAAGVREFLHQASRSQEDRGHISEHAPRIAVILPSAEADRSAIDRVFREVLAPELLPITAHAAAAPWEFSLGQSLRREPMVEAALGLLHWSREALPLDAVSRLLLSPWFAGSLAHKDERKEADARAEFDAFELRRMTLLRPEITLDALLRKASGSPRAEYLSGLLRQLRSLQRTALAVFARDPQRSFADWAEAIRELLDAAGWAGASRLDSLAFQARRKWESALDELAALDFEGVRATFPDALDALEDLLDRTLFAAESRDAPIQIMGPLEAAGSRFDAIWFLRAGDQSWPVPPAVNPLLGWHLQREAAMPGADLEGDRAYARRVTERIAESAPTVIFSYATHNPELPERGQRPSALLAGFTLEPFEAAGETEPARGPTDLEAIIDNARIPLEDPTGDRVARGGASILKSQAACAFRAFAEHRLGSTALDNTETGFDAGERGSLVHDTMERFWAVVESQAKLRSRTPEERGAELDRAIAQALDKALRRTGNTPASRWDLAYIETQRERLRRLLLPWLELELARALPFEVQRREEEQPEAVIGPLRLRLRIDRVDATEAGEVLIDYKTGAADPKAWLTDRPDEPQLPLYAVVSPAGPLAGVAFARLRVGREMGLAGYAECDGIVTKAAPLATESLAQQVAEWGETLTRLAEEFAAGDARVRPKAYPATCQHCAQRLLCRLNPETLAADPDAEEDAPEDLNG